MLGLSRNDSTSAHRMITTSDVLTGFEITAMLGTVEGVAEIGFTALSLSHASVEGGGKLDELVYSAKEQLARAAFGIGANDVVRLSATLAVGIASKLCSYSACSSTSCACAGQQLRVLSLSQGSHREWLPLLEQLQPVLKPTC